jgi:hypothetical protein
MKIEWNINHSDIACGYVWVWNVVYTTEAGAQAENIWEQELGRISGQERNEVTVAVEKVVSIARCYSGYQIKYDNMGAACSKHWKNEEAPKYYPENLNARINLA